MAKNTENAKTVENKPKAAEEIVARIVDIEVNADKTQVSWNKLGDYAVADFPSGKQIHLDMRPLDSMIMKFYGVKQFFSDKKANIKDEAEAVQAIKAKYDLAVKNGLQLSDKGKITIVGTTRSNASEAKATKEKLAKANSMIDLLEKMVAGTITEEEKVILQGMRKTKNAIESDKK